MALWKEICDICWFSAENKTLVAEKGLVEKYKRMVNFKLRNEMRDVKFIMSH